MGIVIALEKENGETIDMIAGDRNILHRLLSPSLQLPPTPSIIDWYGDTTFNRLQMKEFLVEWATVIERALSLEEKVLVDGIRGLAEKCSNGLHCYLKFRGD